MKGLDIFPVNVELKKKNYKETFKVTLSVCFMNDSGYKDFIFYYN